MAPLRFAVIGDPIAHSKSPRMHGAALAALGLPHTYEAVRVTAADLPAIVEALRRGELAGLNVTVPHKRRVLALVDEVAPSARAAGAANTLARAEGGRVVAHNTDVPALVEELRLLGGSDVTWSARRGLVLGSGGSARAAVAALERLGARDVVIRARGLPGWAPSAASEAQAGAIVQATSAGMTGADPGDGVAAVVAWASLPPTCVALDVVYAPPETPFLRAARARGLRAENGLGLLARQGALALQLWLGVEAPLEVMRAALG